MNLCKVLSGLLIVSSVSVLGIEWGGYTGDDVILPCFPASSPPPYEDRRVVWWTFNDTYLGSYIPGEEFKPPSTKYNVTSLSGHLIVSGLVQGEDDGIYECILLSIDDTTGDSVNHTVNVTLTVAQPMGPIHVITNGSTYDGCFEHIGLSPVSCSVLAYPQVTFTWQISVLNPDYCHDMVEAANDTCWLRGDGLWNCSTVITPVSGCFGEYKCMAEHRVGENLWEGQTACIYGKEYVPGAWLGVLGIVLISIFSFLIAAALIIGLVVVFCGGVAFAGTGCALACCHKKSKQVDPEGENIQCEVIPGAGQVGMATQLGISETRDTLDPPPPYSAIQEKSGHGYQ